MTSLLKKKQTICVHPQCVGDVGKFGPYYILYIGKSLTDTEFNHVKNKQRTNFIKEWDQAVVKQMLVNNKSIKTIQDLRNTRQYKKTIENARKEWLDKAREKGLDKWIEFVKSNLIKDKKQTKKQYNNNLELLKKFENEREWQGVKGFQQAAKKLIDAKKNKKKVGKGVELEDKCEPNTETQKKAIKNCKKKGGICRNKRTKRTTPGRITSSECCIPLLDTKGNIEDWGCGKNWLSAETNKDKFQEWVRKFYTQNTVTIDKTRQDKKTKYTFAEFLDISKLRKKYLKNEDQDLIMYAYNYVCSNSLSNKPSGKSDRNTMSDQNKISQGMKLLEEFFEKKFKGKINIQYHYVTRIVAISQRAWNKTNQLQLKF